MGLRWDVMQILSSFCPPYLSQWLCVFVFTVLGRRCIALFLFLFFTFFLFYFITHYHPLLHGSPHKRPSFSTGNFCTEIRSTPETCGRWCSVSVHCIYSLCEVHIQYMFKYVVRSWLPGALTVFRVKKKETSSRSTWPPPCLSKLPFFSAPPSISSNLDA